MCHLHLYKELEEEQVRREYIKEKNFTRDKRKNWWDSVIGILECGYIVKLFAYVNSPSSPHYYLYNYI